MKQKILKFKATQGFGEWKNHFPKEAVAHPAKINLNLLEHLILNYTKEGDVVLDCMAGTFSTVIMAMLNNRNGIGVELEEKFYKWGKKAIENVVQEQTLTPTGKGIAIKGDSRNLSELLKEHKEGINHVLFSPPYAETVSKNAGGASPYERIGISNRTIRKFSDEDENIGNLSFDATIFSPPYFGSSGIDTEEAMKKRLNRIFVGRSYVPTQKYDLEGSIGNIKDFGVDAVLTSPPYEESLSSKHHSPRTDVLAAEKTNPSTYTEIDETVSRLREHGRSDDKAGGAYGRSLGHPYSPSEGNIGNKKKENYLEAMKTVYAECHKVLKPNGLLILILKNFIRDKKVVPLTDHTIKLCESVGLTLKERLLFKLPTQSFWRRLYSQKYPEVDVTDLQYEHILIFKKKQDSQ